MMKARSQNDDGVREQEPNLAVLADLYREQDLLSALRNNGVGRNISSLCAHHLQSGSVDEEVLAKVLASSLSFDASIPFATRTVAFVGPHGVGRSSSVVKLALRLRVALEAQIGLVISRHEGSQSASEIAQISRKFGLPLQIVDDRLPVTSRIPAAIAHLHQCDFIFLDTPGISLGCALELRTVTELLSLCGETEALITLPAYWNERELLRYVNFSAVLGASRAVITHMDRVGLVGPLMNALYAAEIPIGFFASGRRIPEDIEPASARRLAWMLLRRMH